MRLFFHSAILSAAGFCAFGCRAQTLQRDQSEMRASLLEMYQDQVMDNLIRTALFKPLIEVDYKTMTGTVTYLTKGTANYGRESDRTRGTNPAYVIKLTPTIGGEQDLTSQLTVTGDPVTDHSIYLAYEQYLWGDNGAPVTGCVRELTGSKLPRTEQASTQPPTAKDEAKEKDRTRRLVDTLNLLKDKSKVNAMVTADVSPTSQPEKPHIPQGILAFSKKKLDESAVHIQKKFGDNYYYVPKESAAQFYALYSWVVLNRPTSASGPPSGSAKDLAHQLELQRLDQFR